ncbi:hypothetical protein M9H77_23536 [Catharanthus roseus]|uniref:Uncharacterized protein n=1 Tax=Catharanthus roseus TaxID=4058 RepID=A0ACC0ATA6_CATRO|nr:hypothetical protein M9H77_23536 [Catharanthus roseus]
MAYSAQGTLESHPFYASEDQVLRKSLCYNVEIRALCRLKWSHEAGPSSEWPLDLAYKPLLKGKNLAGVARGLFHEAILETVRKVLVVSSISALGCLLRAYFPRPALLSISGDVRVFRCLEGELILNVEKSTKEESIVAKYKSKHHQKVREGSGKSFLLHAVNVSELANSGYSRQSMDWHFFRSNCALQVLTGRVEVGLSSLRLTTPDCFHRRVCHLVLDHPLQTEARIVRELVLVCKKLDLTQQVCKKRSSTRKSWGRSLVIAHGAFLSIDRI